MLELFPVELKHDLSVVIAGLDRATQ